MYDRKMLKGFKIVLYITPPGSLHEMTEKNDVACAACTSFFAMFAM